MASVDMEDTSFVVDYPPGGVTLEVATPEGTVKISNVSINRVEKVAPRLLDDLADGESGPRIIFSQKESKTCAICLLRYIYRIDYLPPRGLVHVPVSLLLHMQMVTIADRLQLVDLKSQAKRNILEELEYACCVNAAAMDLIEAIHYLVLELDSHEDIQENVAHYCVQNLVYHGLDKLELFRQTVFEAPQFHKLLLKVNIDQGFSAEGAPELINMSTCQHPSHSSEDREIARSASFLCHFHAHLDIVTAERRQQAPQNNDIVSLVFSLWNATKLLIIHFRQPSMISS